MSKEGPNKRAKIMSDLKRKTMPVFSASPLATANAQRLIDHANDLKKSEDSPLARAVYQLLFGTAFLTEQTDALRTEVKWNTESTISTELKTRQIESDQKELKTGLENLQLKENQDVTRMNLIEWLFEKGWAIFAIILASGLGGAVTWIIQIKTQVP